jgi:hypothetical protein
MSVSLVKNVEDNINKLCTLVQKPCFIHNLKQSTLVITLLYQFF